MIKQNAKKDVKAAAAAEEDDEEDEEDDDEVNQIKLKINLKCYYQLNNQLIINIYE